MGGGEGMKETSRIHITMKIDGVAHELVNRISCGKDRCRGCVLADDKHRCSVTDYWINWGELGLVPCRILGGIWKKKEAK